MKLRAILYTLLLATLCMGCGGHGHMRQLERLEAQLDTAPEAVRLALDSIPLASLGDEERALYAILRTQADYKCYVPLTTDTLIRYATNYYNRNRKSYRAAMAWYSLGCVYTELEDDVNAIYAYLQAKSYFPDTTTKYHAYCNQNLGTHYLNRNMFDEALAALDAFDKVAISESYDKEMRAASRLKVARIHMHKNLPDRAKQELKDLLQDSLCTGTTVQILYELGKIEYLFGRDYNEAEEILNECITLNGNRLSSSDLYSKAEIAERKGDIDKAVLYYQQALQTDYDLYTHYNCIRNLMYISLDSSQLPIQNAYVKRFEMLYDSINQHERQSEIIDIVNEHELLLAQKEITEKHQRTANIFIIAVLVMIVVSVAFFLQFRNHRLHSILQLQEELRANQTELRKLRETTKTVSADTCGQQRLQELYRKNLTGGIELFKRETKWINQLRRIETGDENVITGFTKSDGDRLRTALYRCFAESIENLQAEGHGIKHEDIVYCLLSAMDYSNRTIATCLGVSETAIRSRKSRMKDKIPSSFLNLFF